MAVLFQSLVHDALATGVAITENPFKPGNPAVFINSQTAGTTVTGAAANELPEQYLVSTASGEFAPELLSRSSVTGGAPVLSTDEVLALTRQLLRIHDAMLPGHGALANAMDVEFALTADRRFVILQARPHTVVYDIDRVPPEAPVLTWSESILRRWRHFAHRFNFRGPRRVSIV
jgi:phosphoenolpyruvate synthase/pyruvate phosphate dikinase